jgi:hypothetical protein
MLPKSENSKTILFPKKWAFFCLFVLWFFLDGLFLLFLRWGSHSVIHADLSSEFMDSNSLPASALQVARTIGQHHHYNQPKPYSLNCNRFTVFFCSTGLFYFLATILCFFSCIVLLDDLYSQFFKESNVNYLYKST